MIEHLEANTRQGIAEKCVGPQDYVMLYRVAAPFGPISLYRFPQFLKKRIHIQVSLAKLSFYFFIVKGISGNLDSEGRR